MQMTCGDLVDRAFPRVKGKAHVWEAGALKPTLVLRPGPRGQGVLQKPEVTSVCWVPEGCKGQVHASRWAAAQDSRFQNLPCGPPTVGRRQLLGQLISYFPISKFTKQHPFLELERFPLVLICEGGGGPS